MAQWHWVVDRCFFLLNFPYISIIEMLIDAPTQGFSLSIASLPTTSLLPLCTQGTPQMTRLDEGTLDLGVEAPGALLVWFGCRKDTKLRRERTPEEALVWFELVGGFAVFHEFGWSVW